jgi:hypothetical protein
MEVNNLDQSQRENLSSGNDQIERGQSEDKNEVFSADKLKTQIDEFNSIETEYKNYLKKKSKVAKLQKVRAELTSKLQKVEDDLSKLLSE